MTKRNVQELAEAMREEAQGSRGEFYEYYASAITPVLEPLAALLEAANTEHPELVELVADTFQQKLSYSESAEKLEKLQSGEEHEGDVEKLWRFTLDWGRVGDVDAVFTATEDEIDSILGKEIYFGELFGKHSEVIETMEKSFFKLITADQKVVALFKEFKLGSGPCPFDFEVME